MIVPDVNLLVYAYNADAPRHEAARDWWERSVNQALPVGLLWTVTCGFIRIMTDARVLERPLQPSDAIAHIRTWLARPSVNILEPGPRHLDILEKVMSEAGVGARLTTDAHIAAVALEHHAEVHSNDRDFGRFAGLRWVNPIARPA